MPKPSPSSYPKEQRWRFVQRWATDKQLIKFSENILRFDGRKIDDVLPELLSFVKKGNKDIKGLWLAIWVNILHQMGLGYTYGKGRYLCPTELCRFLYETKDIESYYLYWALKFQFPFTFPKQKHYIDNGIAIQPIVLILQYLVQLHALTKDINKSYLTKNEITKFLMRSKDHDDILEKAKSILSLRERGYDYSQEEKLNPGFNEAGDHFFSRGSLFIKNVKLIKFSNDKIIVEDENHLKHIVEFLAFATPPILFTENSQDMRNNFSSIVYNHLIPNPKILSLKMRPSENIPTQIRKLIRAPVSTREVTNPSDIRGVFTKAFTSSRTFQISLRRDLLLLYKSKCCICGLDNSDFLRTAHIVPVEIDPSIAADRSNCVLLCVIHDVAFERGLIYLSDDYKIGVNKRFSDRLKHHMLNDELLKRENQKIDLPDKLKPNPEYLQRHRRLHGI